MDYDLEGSFPFARATTRLGRTVSGWASVDAVRSSSPQLGRGVNRWDLPPTGRHTARPAPHHNRPSADVRLSVTANEPGRLRARLRPTSTLREPLPVLTLALTRNFGCVVGISRRPQATLVDSSSHHEWRHAQVIACVPTTPWLVSETRCDRRHRHPNRGAAVSLRFSPPSVMFSCVDNLSVAR